MFYPYFLFIATQNKNFIVKKNKKHTSLKISKTDVLVLTSGSDTSFKTLVSKRKIIFI